MEFTKGDDVINPLEQSLMKKTEKMEVDSNGAC
jgi:hypothetical protein